MTRMSQNRSHSTEHRPFSNYDSDIALLQELVLDAVTLDEALFWHKEIVERIDLEIASRLASDHEPEHAIVANLRHDQAVSNELIDRLQILVAHGEAVIWPVGARR